MEELFCINFSVALNAAFYPFVAKVQERAGLKMRIHFEYENSSWKY